MTRRRWIADETNGNTAALVGDHALHLTRVLRAEIGQEFDIATDTSVRRGTITSISDKRADFALGEGQAISPEPDLTLALAIFKFDRMEWAIEKCTELGITRIVPMIARRTDSHLVAAAMKRRERWQRIALQASEQSRRAAPPEIAAPANLKEFVGVAGSRIVLAESEDSTRLRDSLRSRPSAPKADGLPTSSNGSANPGGPPPRSATPSSGLKPRPLLPPPLLSTRCSDLPHRLPQRPLICSGKRVRPSCHPRRFSPTTASARPSS